MKMRVSEDRSFHSCSNKWHSIEIRITNWIFDFNVDIGFNMTVFQVDYQVFTVWGGRLLSHDT